MALAGLVGRYADRLSALHAGEHSVASALGAWLVLAMAAPASSGRERDQIVEALGADVESVSKTLAVLTGRRHPAVSSALAAWTAAGLDGLDSWRAGLPASVVTGPLPTQLEADRWARENTDGLITSFPIDMHQLVILLANALATRVTWLRPFDLVDAGQLGGTWSATLSTALYADEIPGHTAFIADTTRAGTVAVHSALADDQLEVISVIAADRVPAADVLAAAHQIAYLRATHQDTRTSLFDLPLGDSALWTITEDDRPEAGQRVRAILPSWHATSRHDLLADAALAFTAAGAALRERAGVIGDIAAAQSVAAQYSQHGFRAAAITALGVRLSARAPRPAGPYRIATVRFAHPYAVVASTLAEPDNPWHGVPVFAAWVTQPEDADRNH